jgi:hypothetical protein
MRAYRPMMRCGWLSLVMLLFLAGCGGGGGGGGGDGGLPALTYSGNTSQASVTTLNASRLAANIYGSSDTARIITGTSIEGGNTATDAGAGLEGVARTLNRATRAALASVRPAGSAQGAASGAAVPVDVTEPCDGGMGSVRTTGTIDNMTGAGTLTATFTNCLFGANSLNGQATITVIAFDLFTCGGLPTNFIVSIPRVTLRGPGTSIDAGGSLQVLTSIISFPTATETVTSNLVNLNNLTGVMTKAQDLVSTGMLDLVCTPTSISGLTFSGKIFDNVHGFVDVSTIAPLQIALPQTFPSTGEIRLAGNGTALHVTALSSTRVQLQFDTNADNAGDGFAALMNWTDLSGPVGADIGDTDGDGMHNSWETVNQLNPNANDSAGNPDGDAFTNIQEYQNGTNPQAAN